MPLSSGTRLGPYEIQAAIGAGGMDAVHKARDAASIGADGVTPDDGVCLALGHHVAARPFVLRDRRRLISEDQPADPLGNTELARTAAGARLRPSSRKTRWCRELAACVVEAVLVWGVALGGAAAAQDEQTMTLKGLPGVTVVVTPIGADVERHGLVAAQLQADVERTLRSAGVPVLTLVEQRETPNAPRLRVTVLTYKGGDGVAVPYFYAYTITVRLFQRARLVSSAAALTPFVATWEGSTAMGVWPPESIGGLLELIRDRVNQFANAWRAVHPKS